MSSAVSTLYFSSDTIWIRNPDNCAFYFIIKARPSAVRFKLIIGIIECSPAFFADIRALSLVIGILSGKGSFSAFIVYDI